MPTKPQNFTARATVASDARIPFIHDPTGTPSDSYITGANLEAQMASGGASVVQVIDSASPSAVPSVAFTLPSGYAAFELSGWLLPATDQAALRLRCNDGGGFDDTNEYRNAAHVVDSAGATGTSGGMTSAQIEVHRPGNPPGNATGEGISFHIRIERALDAANTYFLCDTSIYAGFNDRWISGRAAGQHNVAAALTQIQLLFASGNIASGSVRLIGIP